MTETAAGALLGQVRRLYDLFNRRDVDGLLELASPAIEWDWSRSVSPDADVLRGRDTVRQFICSNWELWESIVMTPEELVEAGDDVVVFVRVKLRGRDGIAVEARGPHVQTWRDGLLTRYRLFQDRDQALAAVGLPPWRVAEPDAPPDDRGAPT